jgi:hypothetical protein
MYFLSGHVSGHRECSIIYYHLLQVEEPENYKGKKGMRVKNDLTIYMAEIKSMVQLMFANPSLKWDQPDGNGLRSFANTPFAKVSYNRHEQAI